MYCIKCGIELSKGQTVCPICHTKVYHPDFLDTDALPTYPKKEFQSEEFNPKGIMFVVTILAALVWILPVLFEWMYSGTVAWSGYVSGGVLLAYIIFALPFWFRRKNPVIFVPCDFAAIIVYLLYIDLQNQGHWFLSFAFPVVGVLGLIATAVTTLIKYVRKGTLYTVGGGLIALGLWTVLIEFLIYVTFDVKATVYWSAFPCISFVILGLMLIVIAIVKPFRESFRRIFFIGR